MWSNAHPAPEVTLAEPAAVAPAPARYPLIVRLIFGAFWLMVWLFGLGSLLVGLAIFAAIPVLNLLSLGYLLESSAGWRARGDCVTASSAFGPQPRSARSSLRASSECFRFGLSRISCDPRTSSIRAECAAAGWRVGQLILSGVTGLAFVFFAALAMFIWLAGFRGVRRNFYAAARDAVWDTFVSIGLRHYFLLGLRGFIGAFAWLALPISLLVISRFGHSGGRVVSGIRRRIFAHSRVAVFAVSAIANGVHESTRRGV